MIKDDNPYIINAHKDNSKISLVSAKQHKNLISFSNTYVLLSLRENQCDDESIRVKEYLERCTKERKHHLEDFLREYKGVFRDPKGILPKREVENEIRLFPESPLSNIGLYRQYILEECEVKK